MAKLRAIATYTLLYYNVTSKQLVDSWLAAYMSNGILIKTRFYHGILYSKYNPILILHQGLIDSKWEECMLLQYTYDTIFSNISSFNVIACTEFFFTIF